MNVLNAEKQTAIPMVVQLDEMTPDAFIAYYRRKKDEIEDQLLQHGAVKFTGVRIDSLQTFQQIVNSISDRFLNYVDGNSPRTKLSDNVYTSTEYDQTQKITMHNELSYSGKWPNKLFFSCLKPAETGGETLLADSSEILEVMDRDIVAEIEARGLTYIRNLHGGMGIGPSWQDTFETDDKSQVEAYCKTYAIDFEWREDDNLRLKQPSKGIIEHRITGKKLWFNQIDQFHPCHLGSQIYEVIKLMCDTEEEFPMYVRFGDGKAIPEDMVARILKRIDQVTIAPLWQKNELLVVDNERVAHGRNFFTGDRKVLVAMSE